MKTRLMLLASATMFVMASCSSEATHEEATADSTHVEPTTVAEEPIPADTATTVDTTVHAAEHAPAAH